MKKSKSEKDILETMRKANPDMRRLYTKLMPEQLKYIEDELHGDFTKLISNKISLGEYGFQTIVVFPNGYGASIVKDYGTYGNEDDLFELAPIKAIGESFTLITYDEINPLSDEEEVLGWLTAEDVLGYLKEISNKNKES